MNNAGYITIVHLGYCNVLRIQGNDWCIHMSNISGIYGAEKKVL